MMEPDQIRNVLEACLLVAGRPMSVAQLDALFADDEHKPDRAVIREALAVLADSYEGRGIELVEVAGGWRLQTRSSMEHWVARLFTERPPRYSRALLETLVLIAYRQPITRGEIEEVRGVAVSSNIVRTLQDRQWVREIGHKDVPGKPALLGTTSEFLDYFNLKRLDDLPSLGELQDLDGVEAMLAAELGVVEDGGEAANDGTDASIAPDLAPDDGDVVDVADGADVANVADGADGAFGSGTVVGDDVELAVSVTEADELVAEVGEDIAAVTGDEADVEADIDDGEYPEDGLPSIAGGDAIDVDRSVASAESDGASFVDVSTVTEDEGAARVEPADDASHDSRDVPATDRSRGAVASASSGAEAAVGIIETAPAMSVAVEPIDPDGAEARFFRGIDEFADEHRRELEARDAYVHRSAATHPVPDVDGRAANDDGRTPRRLYTHPGGRPDVAFTATDADIAEEDTDVSAALDKATVIGATDRRAPGDDATTGEVAGEDVPGSSDPAPPDPSGGIP